MRARAARMVGIALLLVATAGCSDDKGPDAEPTPSATATAGESGSTSPDPAPSVAPATGEKVGLRTLSMRLTDEKWFVGDMGVTVSATLWRGAEGLQFSVGDIGAVTEDLDRNAASYLEVDSTEELPLTRGENRTIQGVECFVIEGQNDEVRYYAAGGVSQGYYFHLSFEYPLTWEDPDALIESMLASIEFNPDPGAVRP